MLKKPEGKSSTLLETETVRCSICDGVPAKSVIRVPDSGYVGHKNYRTDFAIPTREIGDSITTLEQGCSDIKVSRCDAGTLSSKVYLNPDHRHCAYCFRAIPKSKSLNNIDFPNRPIIGRYPCSEGGKALANECIQGVQRKAAETTIKYKNVNFRESDSLLSYSGANEKESVINDPESLVNVIHRPITCPVTECHKIVARASILQHFFFDHSKIPRLTLSLSEQRRVFINISAITKEIRCYAVFLIQNDTPLVHTDSDTLMNGAYKNASFLLMGVRMQSAETIKRGKYVSIRHAQTQTEKHTESSKEIRNKDAKAVQRHLVHHHGHHDTIILWICKLCDSGFYYNISIKSPATNVAYSFTGNPLNVGDFNDLQEIYHQVECLRILEKATYKLINEQNELEVTVNIFK